MINLLKGSRMLSYKLIKTIFFLLSTLLILFACGIKGTKIEKIYDNVIPVLDDDFLAKESEINCPKVRFIQGMDKIKFVKHSNHIYEVNFFEVKWKCYSYSIAGSEEFDKNIDLDIKFQIVYENNIKVFKEEKFSFVIALLNKKNEVIIKNKFDRLFLNKENSEILDNQNSIINIKLKNNSEEIYEYTLLLGFIK